MNVAAVSQHLLHEQNFKSCPITAQLFQCVLLLTAETATFASSLFSVTWRRKQLYYH